MVEHHSVAAKMPSRIAKRKDDISEKDEFHLPQIVSSLLFASYLSVVLICVLWLSACSRRKRFKSSR